jgi:beta-glucosidase-like glycosyl hydrolase
VRALHFPLSHSCSHTTLRCLCGAGRTQENLGGDALHVGTLGVALATGLQGGAGDSGSPSEYVLPGGLSLEAKHLVAYGSGDADGAPADMSPMTLHDVYALRTASM